MNLRLVVAAQSRRNFLFTTSKLSFSRERNSIMICWTMEFDVGNLSLAGQSLPTPGLCILAHLTSPFA